ncbi:MAG: DsbA family oxidoreductase [Spirochaetia bacterium]|jgi:predicted DsbA family dithiol-disulfide isomerase
MIHVEIWSDVVCPFCYMGKRRFENALRAFEHKDEVQVTWRSFQLDPDTRPAPGLSVYDYLSRRKGMPASESGRMHDRLTAAAAELGLSYNFDAAVMANTFDAHRLGHLARARGLQESMEERLFAAYFTEGRNIGDGETLAALGGEAGLDPSEVREMLAGSDFAEEVRSEEREAPELGADGVPFYVFDRTYAVSGAQPIELFLEVLQKVWEERTAGQSVQEPLPSE